MIQVRWLVKWLVGVVDIPMSHCHQNDCSCYIIHQRPPSNKPPRQKLDGSIRTGGKMVFASCRNWCCWCLFISRAFGWSVRTINKYCHSDSFLAEFSANELNSILIIISKRGLNSKQHWMHGWSIRDVLKWKLIKIECLYDWIGERIQKLLKG